MLRFTRRKWGWYWTILDRQHFKVKLLKFYRFKSCSRQHHKFRNELWLFLKGSGFMNRKAIRQGQWAMIYAGHHHQYRSITPTLVLEIQYGEKCEESDIVRA